MNQNWDAEQYTDHFSFVHRYGDDVAGLIDMNGVESILDLGCGNGALTARFHDRGVSVTGMDASEEMLQIARREHPGISFFCGDAASFHLETPVDVVFSNAVFHWIEEKRQSDMIRCVYKALKDNGQFVFEMGGHGNNRLIHNALKESFQKRGLADWMRMFVNEPFESVPDAAREEIITETVYRLEPHLFKNGVWHADYVRLRMKVEKHNPSVRF